jgi:hypothetical protein
MKPTTYKAPALARLVSVLNITEEQAATIRGLIRGEIRTLGNEQFPEANKWFSSCYHQPKRLDRILACINEVMGGFGVEAIWGSDAYWPAADYINTGDTYSATLLFNRESGAFQLTTWGDFFERNERRYSLK